MVLYAIAKLPNSIYRITDYTLDIIIQYRIEPRRARQTRHETTINESRDNSIVVQDSSILRLPNLDVTRDRE